MANLFENLALPALNGAGAATDVSAMGLNKTVVVSGSFEGASITIEAATDGSGTDFAPVATFQSGSTRKEIAVAATHMRVNVSGRSSLVAFSANIDVSGNDGGTQQAALTIPAGNGAGASIDVSALGLYTTIVVSGTFPRAAVRIDVSNDGTDWAPLCQFSGKGGIWTGAVTGNYMRAFCSGRTSGAPFTNVTASVCAADDPASSSSAGGAGVFVWTAEKTWAEIYAEMDAADGPKICLVEAVEGGRTMTAGEFNINQIYFWGMEGATQGTLDTNALDNTIINVEDGFVMATSVDPEAGVDVVYLRSKDIDWLVSAATTRLYTLAGFNQANFILEGGTLRSSNQIGGGRTIFVLRGAVVQYEGGAGGLIESTTSGNTITMTAGGSTNGVIFEDDTGAWDVTIESDSTGYFDTGVVSAPGTKSVTVRSVVYRSSNARLYRITVDGAGALALTLDN